MQRSKIEWTHHTFNPWRGCTKVSAGCANCYAEKMSKRNPSVLGTWGKDGVRAVAAESYWRQAIKWNKDAEQAGERRRVFCASMADVFEGQDTMSENEWKKLIPIRARLFRLITDTPNLDWLLLTKRPQYVNTHALWFTLSGCLPNNVWVGTSVEDQRAAGRIPALLNVPARVRFLSCEPLLGAIPNLNLSGIDWVIVGGESGPGARPMHPDWVRSIRDQCIAADVPFFFKQWGEYATAGVRVGKKAAGHILDGREWREMPKGGE